MTSPVLTVKFLNLPVGRVLVLGPVAERFEGPLQICQHQIVQLDVVLLDRDQIVVEPVGVFHWQGVKVPVQLAES